MRIQPLPAWSGRTVASIASGPSLTAEDCATVRAARVPTIVTNTTFRDCLWADALFGFDYAWWRVHLEEVCASGFRGRLFCQSSQWPRRALEWPGIHPAYRSFGNSGACAIALAIAAGARRIVLLGYDAQASGGRSHHHGDHPEPLRNCDTMPKWQLQFTRLARWAEARGAAVLNASRETALQQFPRLALADALGRSAEAEAA